MEQTHCVIQKCSRSFKDSYFTEYEKKLNELSNLCNCNANEFWRNKLDQSWQKTSKMRSWLSRMWCHNFKSLYYSKVKTLFWNEIYKLKISKCWSRYIYIYIFFIVTGFTNLPFFWNSFQLVNNKHIMFHFVTTFGHLCYVTILLH